MAVSEGTRKPVRLPFDFGDVVYHRSRVEPIRGIVTGFIVRDQRILVLVVWGHDLGEGQHQLFELTSEFEPTFTSES
jgi:hypothetical protein